MIRLTYVSVKLFCTVLIPLVCVAEEAAVTPPPSPWKVDGAIRGRYELVDWAGLSTSNTRYGFGHTKIQSGISYQSAVAKLYAQAQYFQLVNLPENGVGPGGSYFTVNEMDDDPGGVALRQGYIHLKNLGLEGLSGQLGRMLYSSGVEVPHPDPQLTWIKNKRIGQRLIGPFDFTGGRSFDGIRSDLKFDGEHTGTFFAARPTQGGFETHSMDQIEDISLGSLVYTRTLAPQSEVQIFNYLYSDDRKVTKTDNRTDELRAVDLQDILITTVGGHWLHEWTVDQGSIDFVLWGALQAGEWGSQDHLGAAAVAEVGYRFENIYGMPWIRTGYNFASGDGDPSDSTHHTFFQLLPTGRLYSQTPFYSYQNLHDFLAQAIWTPLERFTVRSDVHYLRTAASADHLYSGSGAGESRNRFGYSATPTGGENELGVLWDIEATYDWSSQVATTVYYGHLFGGDITESAFSEGSEDVDYGFVELSIKF